MKNLYKFDPNTGKYIGVTEAEVDEWQSKVAGYTCYKGIANAVWDEPPKKEGYTPYLYNGKWELIADPTLDEVKAAKIKELKEQRDTQEVEPIAYNGYKFDYDTKARERISAAIVALDMQPGSQIYWTTADNKEALVSADNLRAIVAAVATRSNSLHTAYRTAKAKVDAAKTKEEVEAVVL